MLENAFRKIKNGDELVIVKSLSKQRELAEEVGDNNIRMHVNENMEDFAGETVIVSGNLVSGAAIPIAFTVEVNILCVLPSKSSVYPVALIYSESRYP